MKNINKLSASNGDSLKPISGINEPVLEENPLLLYTIAYCELIENLTDTMFPPISAGDDDKGTRLIRASEARVDRYIHCRAAWEPNFGVKVQLALRDLSAACNMAYNTFFVGLEETQRIEFLNNIQKGILNQKIWTSPRSQIDTFVCVHDTISSGLLADPGYGGNAGGLGWIYTQFTI